ncbi:MAG: YjbF family lipoprotein, partial [Burkholderiales bacterium]|nr:YjbF family lipoprotein [Burkholderiales bacterium]
LDPRFRYLRVTIDGRTALLALGYVDPHPLGPVEVWYSAEREVIRLQNGRLAGASGLPTEWRRVALDAAPGWAAAVSASGALEWTRRRDVMPGYRYGVEDRLTLSRISPPEDSRFAGKGSRNLIWFEETLAPDARGEVALPPARYALDPRAAGDPVVYGEACLAKDLCFAWQRWPAEAPAGISAR